SSGASFSAAGASPASSWSRRRTARSRSNTGRSCPNAISSSTTRSCAGVSASRSMNGGYGRGVTASGTRAGVPGGDELAGSAGLVDAADRGGAGRVMGLLAGLARDALEGLGERGDRLGALGLGGRDHQRLVHDQRAVDRGRVEALFEQALGNVDRPQAGAPLQRRGRQ